MLSMFSPKDGSIIFIAANIGQLSMLVLTPGVIKTSVCFLYSLYLFLYSSFSPG